MKRILSAGIVREIKFDFQEEADLYMYQLEHDQTLYRVLDRQDYSTGGCRLVVLTQYNHCPLIEDIL